MRMAMVCALLVVMTSAVQAASDDQQGADDPADKLCNAKLIDNTNKYIDCLVQTQAKLDADLDGVVAQIPNSAKVKDEILGKDVAPSARRRWRKNFAGLIPAFRAYRYKNCDDYSIAAIGYGMGGLQWRLACIINATSRQIDELKKRYGLESSSGSREPVSVPSASVSQVGFRKVGLADNTRLEKAGHCLRRHYQDPAHKMKAKC